MPGKFRLPPPRLHWLCRSLAGALDRRADLKAAAPVALQDPSRW